jgi:hypothetical protein
VTNQKCVDRYNRENFCKSYETSKQEINDTTKMMVIRGFENASALWLTDKAGNAAPREVHSLAAGK